MKRIGLIGGISWHATAKYYNYINAQVNQHFGDNTNPPLLIYNVNQSRMHALQAEGRWEDIALMILDGAISLENAGAELLMICSNTTHKIIDQVRSKVQTPFLHIADATAKFAKQKGIQKLGFIGTLYGMKDPFLTNKMKTLGLDIILPRFNDQILELHRIIHKELTYNKILSSSKSFVSEVVLDMQKRGGQGLILGCTEYSLMFDELNVEIPVLDTVTIHAQAAVDAILNG